MKYNSKSAMITPAHWDKFRTYLYIDRKNDPSNESADKSRFFILARYFEEKTFNRDNFNEFVLYLKGKKYSDSYINNFIKIGKHIDRFIDANCIADYTYFKKKRKIVDILTPDEIKRLAEYSYPYQRNIVERNYRMKCLYYFLGTTGARINETLLLTWDDIFSSYIIFREETTKTDSTRQVPLPPFVSELLQGLPQGYKTVFGIDDDSGVNADIKNRMQATGIEKKHPVTAHTFRYSFISTMLKQNRASVAQVSRIVGHKTIESTNHYAQFVLEDMRVVQNMHPLCQQEQEIEDVSKTTREFLDMLINKAKFAMTFKESDGEIQFTISKQNKLATSSAVEYNK